MLVDSHCHLNFPDFAHDLEAVVTRAGENDVKIMQTIGTKILEFPGVLAVAEKFPNIYCSVGVHPHETEKEQVALPDLIRLTENPKVIGIGETGLDYFYEHSPRDLQKKSFLTHIAAARKTGLPLIIHTRNADDDMAEILESEMKKEKFTGLLHCFTSSEALAEKAISLGFYISISGIVTFKKSEELQNLVKKLPLSSLLVETDSPYLAPIPHRGKRNEPAFTKHTAEFIANLKCIPYAEVAKVTTDNFFNLFTKAQRV